jgi:hypothetical protein
MKKQLFSLFFLLFGFSVFPTTYIITNTASSGAGSLSSAIDTANANAGTDTLVFSLSLPATISCPNPFTISDNLVILGPGSNLLLSSAIVQVNTGLTVSISGLKLGYIYNYQATLIINDVVIDNLYGLYNSGSTNATSCTISATSNGIQNSGSMTLSSCTIINNYSNTGGLNNGGNLTLINCTISGNTSNGIGGGGFANYGTCTMTNCTVSGNMGPGISFGGGIYNEGSLSLMNCTVAENTAMIGAGIYNSGGTLTLTNTILSNSSADNYAEDNSNATPVVISNGHNISSDGSMNAYLTATGDMNNTNPLLNGLGNYGGFTQTHSLQCNSPAIDAGTSSGAPASDQRGFTRNTPDIGAFEIILANITANPVNDTVCVNDNAAFSVAGGATVYQWEENQGSGFSVISNGGVYSNAGSSALSIANVTLTMNNYGYRVILTGDCGTSDTTDIRILFVNPLPLATVSASGPLTFCAGDSVVFTAPAGMTNYAWSNGESNQTTTISSSGSYAVLITDTNNCSSTSGSENVVAFALPSVSLNTTGADSLCVNDPSFLLSGESPSGGTWSGTGVSGNNFDPLAASSGWSAIMYSVTDTNGCSNSAYDSIYVDACLGVHLADNSAFEIFPNPSSGLINIDINDPNVSAKSVRIMNVLGNEIYYNNDPSPNQKIDLSQYGKGFYIVTITSQQESVTRKILIE